MTTPWIEVFKAGTHTDMKGRRRKYTLADLKKTVSKFKRGSLDVPAVIGHPKTSDPAYGWVSAVKIAGSRLLAKFTQVDKNFWAAVKAGKFKKRSIALAGDGSLIHVGWLGAVPPAVTGMKDVFSGKRKGKKERVYTFQEGGRMKAKKRKRGMVSQKKFMDMEDDMAKEKKRRKRLQKRLKKAEGAAKKAESQAEEYAAFVAPKASRKRVKARKKRVAKLVASKKITPADRDGVFAYATALARDVKKVKLGDGQKKRTLEDHFLRGLEKGEDSPIFQEFSVDIETGIDFLDDDSDGGTGDNDGVALAKDLARHAGVEIDKEEDKS